MTRMLARVAYGVTLSIFFAASAIAQQRGMPAGGNRADVMNRLRAMMESTGMTPEQVRSRLRAQGYPESLLDSYLPGAQGTDSLAIPESNVFEAVKALGLIDSTAVDTLRSLSRTQRMLLERRDSAFVDSVVSALKTDTTEGTREALRSLLRTRELQRSVADSGFQQFGRSLFDRESSEFDPNLTATVGPDYALGPGDRLVLILTGETERAYDLEVTRQGFVVIPGVGQVSVANLTLGQFEDQLYTVLRRVYSGVRRGEGATTRFSVNVARSGANQIHVTGDVERPGAYQVSRAGSPLTALYLAGGPTRSGSMRTVQLRRSGTVVGEIDLYDYALYGSTRSLPLRSGDILFVPPRGDQVRISGAVLRPATYELKVGETLADLIRMAGGFRPEADRRFVQIDRIVPPAQRPVVGAGRRLIEVASDLFRTSNGPAEPLHAGDIVRVLSIPTRSTGRITVLGNVWQPGPLAFSPGMQLSDALGRAGGLKPDSYLGEIIISRLRADSLREMITASVTDTTGGTTTPLLLADADEIRVFSLTDLRVPTYVTISGAVRKPGRVPYREGMTLRQLVLLAGGLEESALLTEAEVARIPSHRPAGVLSETRRVRLDSSYVFTRGQVEAGATTRVSQNPEFLLQPYDAVLILQQPGWELQQMVTVAGEVLNPGLYAIRNRGERLADIIARAGGVTPNGYPGGVVFVRKRDRVGRIGLNLPAVLRNKRHSDNILLVDRDSVFIPRFEPVVRVRGAVNSPVAVAYVAGQNLDYYINAAGGATAKADKKRSFVTQANGKVQSRSSYLHFISWVPKPQPGSVVVVPEEDPSTGLNLSSIISNTVSLVTAVVAVIAISK